MVKYPRKIHHWLDNKESAAGAKYVPKYDPATGRILAQVARGSKTDARKAVASAVKKFAVWSVESVVKRAEVLRRAAQIMESRQTELAELLALEAGKSQKDSLGEIAAAISCGYFFAGEGRRFTGEVLTSANPNRHVELVRQSIGIGVLITPFNNPFAGIAWKVFPALLCGNSVVIKSHELTPYIAILFAKIFKEAGLPSGVLSVAQGLGAEVGAPLVADERVKFISFTGSLATGQSIIKAGANRLAKISIEAGGKNPFVVCADADLEQAATIAVNSAFIDAGQRCAAASRIIIEAPVYDAFKKIFLDKVKKIKIGTGDKDNYGAIISENRLNQIAGFIERAVKKGAVVLAGGKKLNRQGYFMAPTVLEKVSMKDEISRKEVFGPVAVLYKAKNFDDALKLANDSDFKLTSAIHTKNMATAMKFVNGHQTGVVRVNGPTFGSEPHMPFGGVGLSGNGWREPGTKALDFYSDWKQVSIDL